MRQRHDAHTGDKPTIGFLLIGGCHQMLHLAPVAAEFARRGTAEVTAFVRNATDEAALREILGGTAGDVTIEQLPLPTWARPLASGAMAADRLKTPRLVAARRRLAALDLVVAAERTCTMLKHLPGTKPYLVHIPHGAGDRDQGFEPRIAAFDHVVVAGPKDRNRMIRDGLVRPSDCSISGYIKLAAVEARHSAPAPLFDNGRPTVLYNPHFATSLSSWAAFSDGLIAAFRDDPAFNLIVAPHVRLAERLSASERLRVEAMAVPGRILIDLGSPRSSDMTYTRAANIYVGDVSSQVYEFASAPRPCVFLNPGATEWQDDPSFAFWSFGEVVDQPGDAYAAICRATAKHPTYAGRQAEAVRAAFGPADGSAIARAADILFGLASDRMQRRAARPHPDAISPPRRAIEAVGTLATLALTFGGTGLARLTGSHA